MRRLWLTMVMVFSVVFVFGQQSAEDYYLYKFEREEVTEFSVATDTLLFYRAVQHRQDLYDNIADFRFDFVDYSRRGLSYSSRNLMVDGVKLRRSSISTLNRLGLSHRAYAGLGRGDMGSGGVAGEDNFSTMESVPVSGGNVGLFLSGRGYLGEVRSTLNYLMDGGWSMSLHLTAKAGNDCYVKGVYNDAVDAGLRLSKEGVWGGRLSVLALCAVGDRGLRSGSTEEAYTLIGNKMYNPWWGEYDGRVRNSRYRRDLLPFVMSSYEKRLGDMTTMCVAIGGECGKRAYSSLGWYDAMTPLPDNYRYMPSYFADEELAMEIADEWRTGNSGVTQVNWADMYAQNRRSSRGAIYALEERVERQARVEAVARFSSEIGSCLKFDYGIRASVNSSRHYKQMADLLGAAYCLDVDYYLLDDDTFSRNMQNDLRRPNRRVGEGDRFSYDYALVAQELTADVGVRYHRDRWQMDFDLTLGGERIYRRGYYEKELFPGVGSYGRSRMSKFAPYAVKFKGGYAFSAQHYLEVATAVVTQSPLAKDLFLNPLYNNRIVDNPGLERNFAADVNYRYAAKNLELDISSYLLLSDRGREVVRAYDDLSAVYCDVDIRGIGILRCGVEAAARVWLSSSLRAELATSVGRYVYSRNPIVSHYQDADNSVVCSESESYMDDCRVGGTPNYMATAALHYFNYRSWSASLGVNYAGGRYVDASFIRRTERVVRQGAVSQQMYDKFLSQQRLDDAMTVDASLSKWFRLGKSRLSATLSVKNIFNKRDIVYGGYEVSRIRNYRSGAQRVYAPQSDVLSYAYGRTFRGVISWKF